MDQNLSDSLGRATFHRIAPESNVRPTPRELRWLKHIERHGPQSSQYLFELTCDTHRCKDTALRQMQKLRAGGFLSLPRQQRATERAEFNPYIYNLTKHAKTHLVDLGIDEPTVRPTGHWWHSQMTSRITSSIDIAADREGVQYIPTHKILAIKTAPLAIPIGRAKLIPDQLFALNYGNGFRAFALEVDRGTEPKTSPTNRKSWAKSIAQYQHVIEQQLYKSHYGLKANLLVLWVFNSRAKERQFLEMVAGIGSTAAALIFTQSVEAKTTRMTGRLEDNPYTKPWSRADGTGLVIGCG